MSIAATMLLGAYLRPVYHACNSSYKVPKNRIYTTIPSFSNQLITEAIFSGARGILGRAAVFPSMCVYMCVHVCIHACVYTCVCTCVCEHVCVHVRVCLHVCTCVCTRSCVGVARAVRLQVYMGT